MNRALALLLALTAALPAHAADPRQATAATAMGHQAADAFTAGDFAKAARQYLNAFRLDPSQSALLYGAARSEQMSDQLDLALQHFAEFMAMPGIEPARAENARKYTDEIHGLQADARAREAENAARAGDHAVAARLFEEATRLAPKRLDWLLKSAVEMQAAGQVPEARDRLRDVIARADPGSPTQAEARARLDALQPGKKAAQPGTQPSVHEDGHGQALAWTTLATGAAVALAGLGLGLSTLSDAAALHQSEATRSADGRITGTDYQSASSAVSSLNLRTGLAIGMGAGGLVCAGVGTWLLARGDARATLAPTPGGATLAVRF